MANQRKKTKAHVGAYCEKELKDELVRIAKARGVTVSQILENLARSFCFGLRN